MSQMHPEKRNNNVNRLLIFIWVSIARTGHALYRLEGVLEAAVGFVSIESPETYETVDDLNA